MSLHGRTHNYRNAQEDAPAQAPQPRARHTFALQPVGAHPAHELPDCASCPLAGPCKLRQVANYYRADWRWPFARPECEAAINGEEPDLAPILAERPHTIAELQAITHLSYDTVIKRLKAMRLQGVNIVERRAHGEVVYGYGPAVVRVSLAERILAALRAPGPHTAAALAAQLRLADFTIHTALRALVRAGQVRKTAPIKVPGPAGARWAATWELTQEGNEA